MKNVERACVALAEEILGEAGLTTALVRGKHLRMVVTSPDGREDHLTIAGSPRSDITCQLNFMRQSAHRIVRSLRPLAA